MKSPALKCSDSLVQGLAAWWRTLPGSSFEFRHAAPPIRKAAKLLPQTKKGECPHSNSVLRDCGSVWFSAHQSAK